MFEISERDLNSAPPPLRTAQDNHATLLISWWCTGFAFVIILMRVAGRFVRSERLFTEDIIMFCSIIPLLGRMGLAHVIMIFGTNNTVSTALTAPQIHQRIIGSKIVLASRIFYALFIWTAKWSSSEYLKRLTYATWNPMFERILRALRLFLAFTFIGVVIGTLAECQPFDHYWQVVPDPGPRCRNGYAQLLTMGTSDIITDLLLILFPIPIIFRSSMTYRRKVSLSLLFMLSAFLIAITAVRIVAILHVQGLQQRRTLWASIEILAAAAVSNALVLGSFVRDRGTKKSRFRATASDRIDSEVGPSINRQMTLQHWGEDSDEDLFRTLGSRLNSAGDALTSDSPAPRPAPRAIDMLHLDTVIGSAMNEGPMTFNGTPSPRPSRDYRPQTLAAFLRELDTSSPGFQQKEAPSNGRIQTIRPPENPRHDFDAVDWNGATAPEDMQISDAGGLLSDSPHTPQSILRRGTDSAEVSPMNPRPRTGFPDLRIPSIVYPTLLASSVGLSGSARISRDIERTTPYPGSLRSMSRNRPAPIEPTFDDMEISDAGGLLT